MQNKNSNFIARFLFITIFISLLNSCLKAHIQEKEILPAASQPEEYLLLLKDKKVGLVVNQTSLVNDSMHLVDILIENGISVDKIFSPEHGFRGEAADGTLIENSKDGKTGIPIVSLYGTNRKPNPESFQDLDVIIFDIQDVGARFYTYISTMHYVMQTCAQVNIPLIIFDRPNPNGYYVDGPVLQPEYQSFVGLDPIPVVHGMTVGELAQMINGEGWLADSLVCDLNVIKVKNYNHASRYSLPVKPSPNLPNDKAINLYPSICFFEGTQMSLGRGTGFPFQVLGYPDSTFGNFQFTPVSIPGVSDHPPLEGKLCYGIDLRQEPELNRISLKYLIEFYQKWHGEKPFFREYINQLAGNSDLKKQIESGMSEEEIRKTWQADLVEFKKKRKKYLLYQDFE